MIKRRESRLKVMAILFALTLGFARSAWAQSLGVVFETRIVDPQGKSLATNSLELKAQILAPNNCILREEKFVAVPVVEGHLQLRIGSGVPEGDDPGIEFSKVFDNSKVLKDLVCLNADGSVNSLIIQYSPSTEDSRRLRVAFYHEGELVQSDFNFSYSASAVLTQQLQGKTISDFVQRSTTITQDRLEEWLTSPLMDQMLQDLYVPNTVATITGTLPINRGGTGATNAADARTNLGLGSLATKIPKGTASPSTFLRGDDQWAQPPPPNGSSSVTSVAGKGGEVVLTAADVVGFGTQIGTKINAEKSVAGGFVDLDENGKVKSSQLALVPGDIPPLGWGHVVSGRPNTLAGYGIVDAVRNAGDVSSLSAGPLASRPTSGRRGSVYIVTDQKEVYLDTGTAWVLLSSLGADNLIGPVPVSVFPALAGDVTSNAGSTQISLNTVAISKGGTGATTPTGALNNLLPPQVGAVGQSLKTDGTNASWFLSGQGTVTSFGVSHNQGLLSIGGSPIISSGTISIGFTSQPSNTVFAGPTSGGAAVPGFRKLQRVDFRSTNGGGEFLTGGACANEQGLVYNSVSDTMSCSTLGFNAAQVTTALGYSTVNSTSLGSLAGKSVVNLATAEASGTLAAARFPAFSGAITNTAGSLVTTLANNVVTSSHLANDSITNSQISASAAISWSKINKSGSTAADVGAVRNGGGAPSMQAGVDASKPGFGVAGRLYIATDTKRVYYDTGTAWVMVATTNGADLSGNLSGSASNVTGSVAIANGGMGTTTQAGIQAFLLPSQTGNSGKYLTTNGSALSWGAISPPANQGPTSCPSGWSLVGASGGRNSFCITTSEQSITAGWSSRSRTQHCINLNSNQWGAHTCNLNEWYAACKLGGSPAISNMINNAEFFEESTEWVDTALGNGSCSTITEHSNASLPFRCCF